MTAQAASLIKAWKYSPADHFLHVLPLHHIHGVINALYAPLLEGSTVEFLFPFNPWKVWKRLIRPFVPSKDNFRAKETVVSVLTAVPTIYNMLLSNHSTLDPKMRDAAIKAISPKNLRLNISGSAPLTPVTKKAWSDLSRGNILLERYGMTETGMILSCGLAPADRVDGSVGWPLPGVEVRLVDLDTNEVIPEASDEASLNQFSPEGEIQVRGPTIFSQYWKNPQASQQEFVNDPDGGPPWFRTGDIAARRTVLGAGNSPQTWAHGPMYFIRGRQSVDIIKTGGEKVSALEVENALLSLREIAEAAVIGVPSVKWGQRIVAVVVLSREQATGATAAGKKWSFLGMRRLLRNRLARHKIPQDLQIVERLAKNAMGKGEFARSLD